MFSLFSRPKPARKISRSYRPTVDRLETRDCPAMIFNAQVLPGHMVLLSGTVSGQSNNAGLNVSFSGAVSPGSTTTDANGNFTYTTNAALPRKCHGIKHQRKWTTAQHGDGSDRRVATGSNLVGQLQHQ